METIERLDAYIVYNNRLQKTVEVEINGKYRGAAPSGASKGSAEVKYLSPKAVVKRLKEVFPKYIGEKIEFEKLDREIKLLKSKLGGNGSIAFSFALFNASFKLKSDETYEFPYPLGNVIGGGAHHGFTHIQEFLVLPVKAKTFPKAIEIMVAIYKELMEEFTNKFCGFNDEGAMIIKEKEDRILDKIERVALRYSAKIGVDFAATSYYDKKSDSYIINGKKIKSEIYKQYVLDLIKSYHLIYVEDPVHEKDFEGFAEISKKSKKTYVTGDDLTTTNLELLKKAIKYKAITGIIIKPNQIGTITEALEAKALAEKHNILPVLSHRSGEADDYTISRLALAYKFKVIKAGISQSRIPKLNELMRLWYKSEKKKMSKI